MWLILIYSLWVCVAGNPAHSMVKAAPSPVIQEAAECLEDEIVPEDEDIYSFLQKFFRLTYMSQFLFLIEICVAWYLVFTEPNLWIAWFILIKNLVDLCRSFFLGRSAHSNIIYAVLEMPRWLLRWDRFDHLLSAACFLYLFLRVNGLMGLEN